MIEQPKSLVFVFRTYFVIRHSAFVLRHFANCSKPWRQRDSHILRDPQQSLTI